VSWGDPCGIPCVYAASPEPDIRARRRGYQNARQLHARKRHSYLLVLGKNYVFPKEDRPKRRVKPQRISVEEMLSWLE